MCIDTRMSNENGTCGWRNRGASCCCQRWNCLSRSAEQWSWTEDGRMVGVLESASVVRCARENGNRRRGDSKRNQRSSPDVVGLGRVSAVSDQSGGC